MLLDSPALSLSLSFLVRACAAYRMLGTIGNHSALFSAVLAIRTKLVEGTSAPFDLPVRPNRSRTGGGGGGGGADHNHGHGHGHEDDEDNPYNQNG